MESSPLIKAYDYAKAASIATQAADTTVAINQHALAAGEFSNAAKSTSSAEALRTLGLLEQYHKRLSELLKHPLEPTSQQSSNDGDIPEEGENEHPNGQDTRTKTFKPLKADLISAVTPSSPAKTLPTLPQPRGNRYPSRELSSSIASNLASARGIRSKYRGQPLTPSVSNDQAPGSLEVHPRRDGASSRGKGLDAPMEPARKPSWIPPALLDDLKEETSSIETSKPEQPRSPPPSDEGFSRFYSTFGNLIHRLSAPLAFAGLPLTAADEVAAPEPAPATSPEPPAQRRFQRGGSGGKSTSTTAEPDLSKIFSRATLRALTGGAGGANDSFYVVPTSGHTATYASILNHETKEKRRMAASIHSGDPGADDQDDDDFVDARESQMPPLSPALRKRLGAGGRNHHPSHPHRSDKDMQINLEELSLENASLKEIVDKLSKRLHAFELNSQSSHLALVQSLRLQRPSSPLSSSGGVQQHGGPGAPSPSEEVLKRRNRELEEQLVAMMKRTAVLERDHDKLNQTLEKYRERWEKLKAGAKARREAQDSGADGEGSSRPAPASAPAAVTAAR
ncbi:hypothetical protein B0T17DRAFT_520053 [Bombardia bombarda]|uniref:Uncharacterized protein n=1 Tax=Bombardia bombarda TaxID=252184 RepID=A0AA39XMM2_9PEZI|nr:hypothetical protein B0T17DRAFT_520053 [Bombardia bombarda]